MGLLVEDVLRRAGIHVAVALQLEEEIQDIDQQQDHTGATADTQCLLICPVIVGEGRVESRREQETHDGQTEHTCAHLRDSAVVDLPYVS